MIQIDFTELSEKVLLNTDDNHFVINKDGEEFHIKLKINKNINKLVVFSNGAVDHEIKKPPIFMRESWVDETPYNALFIDDKTVHNNDLKIGWGVGVKDRHFLKDYSEIVKKIANILAIDNNKVFYYGSSAGGFMSMAMASMHKNSTAIVNNPQTYVFNYYASYVNDLYNTVFPNMKSEEINVEFSDRLSITRIFREFGTPKTFYLQNRLCVSDMTNHYNPFVRNLDKYKISSDNINFIFYNNKKSGHFPLGKEDTLKIINSVIFGTLKILK